MGHIENPLKNDAISHPGLLLEKWHEEWDEWGPKEFARQQLSRVVKTAGDEGVLQAALQRRRAALTGAEMWRRKTTGPMSLHLAASGSFENAGICLHPLYGFAYMPGTGIKGMARAYAVTVAGASEEDLRAVFGPEITGRHTAAECGGVVFYEAWPTRWPKLEVDIVNNHHRDYYEGKNDAPPEDWEQPNPVNFLTVKRGVEFEFALAARRKGDADGARLVKLAKGWVDGALQWLGAGAKTNAGYGRFATDTKLPESCGREDFECTVRLVSPAFLAGAMQGREDCTLRAATLRGLLRWWWRTLHAGYLTVEQLRELEGVFWGTTEAGGLISVEVEPVGNPVPKEMQVASIRGEKPGRSYLAYGMEASGRGDRFKPARHYLEAGAEWRVRLVGKGEHALPQGRAALWMLCTFGGVGAKARRGYGSIDSNEVSAAFPASLKGGLVTALETAAAIRPGTVFREDWMRSPSVHRMDCQTFKLSGNSVWAGIDSLGEAYRAFNAQLGIKHRPEKLALGLPRSIHRYPQQERLTHPAGGYDRHASPVHFRLIKHGTGYAVRVTAFTSAHLAHTVNPAERLAASKAFLKGFVQYMKEKLGQ
jgi:CRISPR-associated protein Cmr6